MATTSEVTLSTFAHTGDLELAFEHSPANSDIQAPHIMFCGGFHSAMQGAKAQALKAHCREQGWHFTRFDYSGHGQSGGAPADFTLSNGLDDTLAMLDEHHPSILIGSSMGAWLATLAALRRPEKVNALLLLAAAPDFISELMVPKLSVGDIWDLSQGNVVDVPNNYDEPFKIKQALIDSGKELSLLHSDALNTLACPVRMLHGTHDNDVPFELAIRMMSKLPKDHDAALTLLHGADHRLSDETSLATIFTQLDALVAHIT